MCPYASESCLIQNAMTIDYFLCFGNVQKSATLIIDNIGNVPVLKFWKCLEKIKPVKVLLLGDVDDCATQKLTTQNPNLLLDVLLPLQLPTIYLETNYRLCDQNCLRQLIENKVYNDKMDESFHVITCASMQEMENQVMGLVKLEIQYISTNPEIRSKFNFLLSKNNEKHPIVCKKNFRLGEVKNGQFGYKIKNTLLFNKVYDDVIEYELAYVLSLDNARGHEFDMVVLLNVGKKIPLNVLYIAASRAKKKFLILSVSSHIVCE